MSELQSNAVDIQTQLNCALELLTKDQANTWELQMQLIQRECEVMGARKRISELEERVNELSGVYEGRIVNFTDKQIGDFFELLHWVARNFDAPDYIQRMALDLLEDKQKEVERGKRARA